MYSNLIKLEFKKHLNIFIIAFIFSIALNIIFLKSAQGSFDMIYLLANLVLSTLILAYIFLDIYNEFYTGKDVIMHMIPIKTAKLFFAKVLVFTIGLILIWLPSFIEMFFDKSGIYNTRIVSSSKPFEGIIYILLQKTTGTISGLLMIGLSIAISKYIYDKRLSKGALAIVFFSINYIIYRIDKFDISKGKQLFYAVGTTSTEAFKNYIGFIPVMFIKSGNISDISNTIYWNSIYINIIACIIAIIIVLLTFNSKKYQIQ